MYKYIINRVLINLNDILNVYKITKGFNTISITMQPKKYQYHKFYK